jgi:hypothetical protein
MEQKKNKDLQPIADSSSQPIAKPLVVRSPNLMSNNEVYIESNGENIKASDRILFVSNFGQINIPIVELFDFIKNKLQEIKEQRQSFILSD